MPPQSRYENVVAVAAELIGPLAARTIGLMSSAWVWKSTDWELQFVYGLVRIRVRCRGQTSYICNGVSPSSGRRSSYQLPCLGSDAILPCCCYCCCVAWQQLERLCVGRAAHSCWLKAKFHRGMLGGCWRKGAKNSRQADPPILPHQQQQQLSWDYDRTSLVRPSRVRLHRLSAWLLLFVHTTNSHLPVHAPTANAYT